MAQTPAGSLVITPYVGVYATATDVMKEGATTAGLSVAANAKHQTAAAYGLNASYWLTERVGVELGGAYSSSQLEGTMTATGFSPISMTDHANIWLGSAKMMFQLLPADSRANLRLGVGPAIISRAGAAYAGDESGKVTGLTDLGGAVSLCTRIPITRDFGIRLRGEDYIYQAKIGWSGANASERFAFNSRMQHDFVFSAGFQLNLSR